MGKFCVLALALAFVTTVSAEFWPCSDYVQNLIKLGEDKRPQCLKEPLQELVKFKDSFIPDDKTDYWFGLVKAVQYVNFKDQNEIYGFMDSDKVQNFVGIVMKTLKENRRAIESKMKAAMNFLTWVDRLDVNEIYDFMEPDDVQNFVEIVNNTLQNIKTAIESKMGNAMNFLTPDGELNFTCLLDNVLEMKRKEKACFKDARKVMEDENQPPPTSDCEKLLLLGQLNCDVP